MIQLKRMFSGLGWDGWAFLLCGVAAVTVAVLDFTQIIHVSSEDALRLIIIGGRSHHGRNCRSNK